MIPPHKRIADLYRTLPRSRHGYLRLDMNEGMPGLPMGFVKRAMTKMTPGFLAMYPEYDALKKTIACHNGIKPENICLSNGSDGAIKYIFETYISPGDKVLLTDPTFAMYPVYCKMSGAKSVMVEYEKDFSFPIRRFCDNISGNIKMAVVINPNNPTGTGMSISELLPIIKKAWREKVLLIVDEAYFYFFPETAIRLVSKYDNLIVLRTFSKLCGLAGVRIGYAASCPNIAYNIRKVRPTYDVNGPAAFLAEELLRDKDILRGLVRSMSEGSRYLCGKLDTEGIDYRRGDANFILIKCPDKAPEIVKTLEKNKVLVGGNFKQDFLKDYIRVTVSNEANMQKFWNVFIKIWRRLS